MPQTDTNQICIVTTPRDLLDRGLWTRYCHVIGVNSWAIQEGLMDENERIEMTFYDAYRVGLVDAEEPHLP